VTVGVVTLGRSGVLRLRSGHPWVFAHHVVDAAASDGDLVRVEGPPGTPRGMAVYGEGSRIALRVVAPEARELDPGGWWRDRVDRAVVRRTERLAPGEGACRWVHGEADGLPGLVVDRFGDVAVVQAGCRWAESILDALAKHLVETHGLRGVLARNDGGFRRPEGLSEEVRLLAGEVARRVPWRTAGIVRSIEPWTAQKTGAYLDQRENHAWAARVLPVGRAIDAFCNDGGFALHLAAAGSRVEALDSSRRAIERVEENARANGLDERIAATRVNVFEQLRESSGDFDAIVLDPPALAKRRADGESALRAYKDLNLRALRLLRPGGRLVTCSCSFHVSRAEFVGMLRAATADARREVDLVETRGAAACHPHRLLFPESDYLKVVLLEVTA